MNIIRCAIFRLLLSGWVEVYGFEVVRRGPQQLFPQLESPLGYSIPSQRVALSRLLQLCSTSARRKAGRAASAPGARRIKAPGAIAVRPGMLWRGARTQ